MKNLYLDIDGVLLKKDGTPAENLVSFLKYATENFNCYWLTTHCDGDATPAFLYLVGKVPQEAAPFLEKIQPTKWKLWKTEGIDFSQDFLWLDDTRFEGEQNALTEKGASDKFVFIDLKANPNQLLDMVNGRVG
jgi:hypothetical protein